MMLNRNGVPSKSTYIRRFGSVYRAYQLIGYRPSRRATLVSQNYARLKRWQDVLVTRIAEVLRGRAERLKLHGGRPAIRLDTGLMVSVLVCRHYIRPGGVRWELRPVLAERGLITLIALMSADNQSFETFYVMPGIDKSTEYQIKGKSDPWLRTGVKLRNPDELYSIARTMVADTVQPS